MAGAAEARPVATRPSKQSTTRHSLDLAIGSAQSASMLFMTRASEVLSELDQAGTSNESVSGLVDQVASPGQLASFNLVAED